jgi:hypothetical protein
MSGMTFYILTVSSVAQEKNGDFCTIIYPFLTHAWKNKFVWGGVAIL